MTEEQKRARYGPVVLEVGSRTSDKVYQVRRRPGAMGEARRVYSCNCPGWATRKHCKHIVAVDLGNATAFGDTWWDLRSTRRPRTETSFGETRVPVPVPSVITEPPVDPLVEILISALRSEGRVRHLRSIAERVAWKIRESMPKAESTSLIGAEPVEEIGGTVRRIIVD